MLQVNCQSYDRNWNTNKSCYHEFRSIHRKYKKLTLFLCELLSIKRVKTELLPILSPVQNLFQSDFWPWPCPNNNSNPTARRSAEVCCFSLPAHRHIYHAANHLTELIRKRIQWKASSRFLINKVSKLIRYIINNLSCILEQSLPTRLKQTTANCWLSREDYFF